ncbi:hypothetical protein ACFE04_021874 [Oxalis oulophora]
MASTSLGISKPPFLLHILPPNKKPNKTHHLFFTLNPIPLALFTRQQHKQNSLFAIKKGSKPDDPLDIDDLFEEVENEESEYSVDDKPDGVYLFPLGKMKEWYDNKPSGFGEGKVYDTQTEDKLFDEIQQTKLLLAVKNETKKKAVQVQKVPEAVSSGIRVRLTNLPKKKNVHRDLKYAFKEVSGIIKITPAVSGNKKTRDPVCKGFAFVEFRSQKDATRFIQMFSEQSIAFGKVQKMITCEMVNSHSTEVVPKEVAADVIYAVPEVVNESEESPIDFEIDDSSIDVWAEDADDKSDLMMEGTERLMETVGVSMQSGGNGVIPEAEFQRILMSLNPPDEIQAVEKKQPSKGKVTAKKQGAKEKGKKSAKLDVPGSAKRLKVREKAMLTDVFFKYGAKPVSAKSETDK